MKTLTPTIRVKRAYEPQEAGDGARVLVDRLWPRGLRKEKASFSYWLKEIAPTPGLRKWFDHDVQRFEEFARRYRAELANDEAQLAQLEELAKQGPVTLLYAAHDEIHNHARVLAEYLRERLTLSQG